MSGAGTPPRWGLSRLKEGEGKSSSSVPHRLLTTVRRADQVPSSTLRGEELLRLRAELSEKARNCRHACTPALSARQELECLELRSQHAALLERVSASTESLTEALAVKDRTIDQLAAALDAREEALARQSAEAGALREVQGRVTALAAKAAEVERLLDNRVQAAQRYKTEARRLRAELAKERSEAEVRERKLGSAAGRLQRQYEQALGAARGETEAALRRAGQEAAARGALEGQVKALERIRDEVAAILGRLAGAAG